MSATFGLAGLPQRLRRHLRRVRDGEPELARAFLVDMMLHGTLLNVTTSGLALLSLAMGAPAPVSLAIFLLPIPYNILLCRSVFRAGDRRGGATAGLASILATFWTITFLFV